VVHEAEPVVSLHLSVILAAALVGVAFWIGGALVLPWPAPSRLVVPIALATTLLGFLVIVTRRKAVTQVVGYLMLENGVFVFGQALARELPFVVELGILLDVLVGVFVMGIAIHHISREFDHIDVDALSTLRD
jgi:hydrogenase-4 component E